MGLQWSRSAPEEREALLGLPTSPARGSRVFGRRWLVLGLFSMLAFMQGLVWNTWGPIQGSAKQVYGFSNLDIALLVLWGPIGFLPCFLFMWLMDKKGKNFQLLGVYSFGCLLELTAAELSSLSIDIFTHLHRQVNDFKAVFCGVMLLSAGAFGLRVIMLLTSALMVIGSGLRCVPVSNVIIKQRLIHAGQLFNGLAGPTVMNAGPFLSTTWFSPDERATATAIASLLCYFGGACAFLVGPLVVPGPNGTAHLASPHGHNGQMRDRIEAVMYGEFGIIALIFAASVAYFPMRPPVPPSVAAASRRLSYRSSIWKLLSNVRFLMIAVAYALPSGVFGGWSGVLDLILTPLHITQVNAGWIGFWSIVGGCVVGIALARFADYIRGMLKLILVLLFSGATLSATWFTLTSFSNVTHLPLTSATLYASCILLGVFLNSSVPIFFELFVETVYPIPEGITCGVVTFLSNIFMGVLLSLLTFYHTELSWLNWCLTGSCLLSLLFILCFRESYDRLYLDVFVSV